MLVKVLAFKSKRPLELCKKSMLIDALFYK